MGQTMLHKTVLQVQKNLGRASPVPHTGSSLSLPSVRLAVVIASKASYYHSFTPRLMVWVMFIDTLYTLPFVSR